MQQLQVNATFPSISPDASDQFKQLAAEALATIRGEPGTLQHDWFFSDDGARCVVCETYASSDAFLAHLTASGALLGRLVELGGGLELEVYGEPSAALHEAIAAFQPRIYGHSQGKSAHPDSIPVVGESPPPLASIGRRSAQPRRSG
jgi:quinol monooxygenase YgiN